MDDPRLPIPIGERLLARERLPGYSKGGIALPEGSADDTRLEVLAVGPDVKQVQAGDLVHPNPVLLLSPAPGVILEDGRKLYAFREIDILAYERPVGN